MDLEIPIEAQRCIESNAEGMLDNVFYELKERFNDDEWQHVQREQMEDILEEMEIMDAVFPGMSLETELTTIERSEHADGLPFELDFDRLRSQIESAFTYVVHLEATAVARAVIEEVCEWRENHELEDFPMSLDDPLRWFAPHQVREVDAETDVTEYRNADGMNVDVWQFRHELLEVFVAQELEA